jgi:TPR repeat protein
VSFWLRVSKRENSWWWLVPLLFFSSLSGLAVLLRWPTPILAICLVLTISVPLFVAAAKQRAKEIDASASARKNSIRTAGSKSPEAPLAKQVALEDWGVHPSLVSVPYLKRDIEGDILAGIEANQPVLVVGPSMAGKTRVAARLVQECFPDRQVVMPDIPDGLAVLMAAGDLPQYSIVWLDDLERYLTDPKHLKARWIDELSDGGNVIIATMRANQYEAFQPSDAEPKTQWATLNKFQKVHLSNQGEEQARLAARMTNPRLQQGILEYGLGIYVGGGYIARERLRGGESTNPLGAAMIRAAIDWQRTGIAETIPHDVLLAALPGYFVGGSAQLSEEAVAGAIGWVSDAKPLGGKVGLLTKEEDSWRPFDFLVDEVTASGTPVSGPLWQLVVKHDAPPARLNFAGLTAHFNNHPNVAETLFRRAAEAGDPEGMANWAKALNLQDRFAEALEYYRRAADAGSSHGMTGVGIALMAEGKYGEAEIYLRQAAEHGNPDGMANLGNLLLRQKKVTEGTEWYRKASVAGSAYGMVNYGLELAKTGRNEEAEDLYRQAAAMNSAGGLYELSQVYAKQGNDEQSELLTQRAVAGGNPHAMVKLAGITLQRGNPGEAENLYRRAAKRGPGYQARLGAFLAEQGRTGEAEPLLKRAADLGEPYAYHCLGVIAAGRSTLTQAIEFYRTAIGYNSIPDALIQSKVNLAQLLLMTREDDNEKEAEQLCRDAVAAGSGQGMVLLSLFHKHRGEDDEAQALIERAQSADDAGAAGALQEYLSASSTDSEEPE